jgi:hypothetical protein
LLVAAPLILTVALPGALSAQTIFKVAPRQCVWRAGDDPAWAAPPALTASAPSEPNPLTTSPKPPTGHG